MPWEPHGYQRRAVDFLMERGAGALFLDPGLGKTAVVLDAFRRLQEAGIANRMLVVAPLRVCQMVWRQEAEKWTDFNHLKVSLIHGPRKEERLADDADIWLINPEGITWLCDKFWNRKLPWDTVVFDELTRFKNARAQRSRRIRPKLASVQRRWGLTGTPTPNGYMDLFGQMLVLDDGAALGGYITHYRTRYFEKGFDGFTWSLRLGADKQIEDRIKPYVLRMSAEDYLELPPLVQDVRTVTLPPKMQKQYDGLKKELLLELPDATITASNAGALYSKLKQMANGGIYFQTTAMDPKQSAKLHDIKNEYLEELVEELAGQPLLVAYEFQHDLERMRSYFGERLHYIRKGMSDRDVNDLMQRWNAGEIDMLAVHPASAGHGLNLQLGSAAHICWYSLTVDYELYDQLIRRVWRQGTKATRIINHILIVEKTVDEKSLGVIDKKRDTQNALLDALSAEFDQPRKEPDMAKKLKSRRDIEAEAETEEGEDEQEEARPAKKRSFVDTSDDGDDQKSRVRSRLRGRRDEEEDEEDEDEEPVSSRAEKMLDDEIKRHASQDDDEDDDEPEEEEKPKARPARRGSQTVAKKPVGKTEQTDKRPPTADDTKAVRKAEPSIELDYDKLAAAMIRQLFQKLAE